MLPISCESPNSKKGQSETVEYRSFASAEIFLRQWRLPEVYSRCLAFWRLALLLAIADFAFSEMDSLRRLWTSFAKHSPKLAQLLANWGWAGMMGVALTMESAREYGIALILFLLGAITLVATCIHWKGYADSYALTRTMRIAGFLVAAALGSIGAVWAIGEKGQEPWSRLPDDRRVVFHQKHLDSKNPPAVQINPTSPPSQPTGDLPPTNTVRSPESPESVSRRAKSKLTSPANVTTNTKQVDCPGGYGIVLEHPLVEAHGRDKPATMTGYYMDNIGPCGVKMIEPKAENIIRSFDIRNSPQPRSDVPTLARLVAGNLKQRATEKASALSLIRTKYMQEFRRVENDKSLRPQDATETKRQLYREMDWSFRDEHLAEIKKLYDEFAALHIRDKRLDRFFESEDQDEQLRKHISEANQQFGARSPIPEPRHVGPKDNEDISNALVEMAGDLP